MNLLRKKKEKVNSEWSLNRSNLPFTASTIQSCLNDNYLIKQGAFPKIYKIPLNQSPGFVVVREVQIKHDLHDNPEKTPEVEILIKIDHHPNILKLIDYMWNDRSRLLMYEYLENGSLDCWLHRNRTPPSPGQGLIGSVLDWPKRLNIAVGVARALSYMHHECCPPVVHNDVKSSNILLDAHFNAKIKKFGLAKFLAKASEDKETSTADSFGSKGPEYDHTTKEIEKTDVYYFGVILLELLTGKEPRYKLEYKGERTKLAEWASKYGQPGGPPIADALDKDVNKPMYLPEMTNTFELGVWCTLKQPTQRPSMKEVCDLLPPVQSNRGGWERGEWGTCS